MTKAKPQQESCRQEVAKILVSYDKRYTVASLNILLDEIESIISAERLNLLNEVRELVEKQKLGTYKEWIGATRKYGGTREEWEKLNNRGHDRVIDDLLSALNKLEQEQS